MAQSGEHSGRNISFSPEKDVRYVRNLQQISDDEKAYLWSSDKERDDTMHSILKTVRMIQMNGKKTRRCIRGIEQYIFPEFTEQKKINKDCVLLAVLQEQDRQKTLGIYDPEELRNASKSASEWARNLALKDGAEDAKEVSLH
uniref:Uncharacterized protein n=1 Tax=Helicotheca tamesis TaxID=374047 RepID=A0A7S2DYN1_9STRA|mmetsp:Transcript_11016/g.15288  ORF Transcript_11016/g.15288 Transcript_11016/m.15288 type:complete len:143 (+) Transcript_11016:97-525(+)